MKISHVFSSTYTRSTSDPVLESGTITINIVGDDQVGAADPFIGVNPELMEALLDAVRTYDYLRQSARRAAFFKEQGVT